MHFTGDKTSTRFLEQNIQNLAYAQFSGAGEFDLPVLDAVHIENLSDIPLQGFNFALKEKEPQSKGVHFFLHDYQFERVWKYPDRYVEVLKRFAYVLSPDFSPYGDSPKAVRVFNVYRNRWCAKYWAEHGITVIPTITWGDNSDLEWCFDGLPKHSTIAISTMGEGRWANWSALKQNWDTLLTVLEPDEILLYGKDLSKELDGPITFKPMMSRKVGNND